MDFDVRRKKMRAINLEYSKGAIRRAGEFLSTGGGDVEFFDAYTVLDNWRVSHDYPIQSMLGYFRNKAFDCDKNAIVARRLKRTPSIIEKLRRESGMKLDRMEDIGGVRIVVSDLKKVEEVRRAIVDGRTRNLLRRDRDYILRPKDSGYRGVHLIYRYNGAKKADFPFHNVELQVRTKAQHAWATTVEVVGTFTRQGLKASEGEARWLDFFKLAGKAFAAVETGELGEESLNLQRELVRRADNLGVMERLQAYAVTTRYLNERPKKGDRFFIMTLNANSGEIGVSRFQSLEEATSEYGRKELELRDSDEEDVVLVSTESIKTLKLAYPNYFADTTHFRQQIRLMRARTTGELL